MQKERSRLPVRGWRGAALLVLLALVVVALGVLTSASAAAVVVLLAAPPAAVAVVVSGRRERELSAEREARVQADVLARAGALLEAPLEALPRLQQLTELAVPDLAGLAIVELVGPDDTLRLTAVAAADPALGDRLRVIKRQRPPALQGDHPSVRAIRTGVAQLVAPVDGDTLRAMAVSDEHLELLGAAGLTALLALPIAARGRTHGALMLARVGGAPPFTEDEVQVLGRLAARASLAVDNAVLVDELRANEGRLDAILSNLSEAVTAFGPDGSVLFANAAAAALAGVTSSAELTGMSMERTVGRWIMLDEHGQHVAFERLPRVAALRGERSDPLLVHTIDRDSAEERWFVSRAQPVHDADGALRLVVAVTEDVTALKRQERDARVLSSASKLVSSSLAVEATVDKAAWAVVPELCDWARLDLVDAAGVLREAAVAHRDLNKLELLREWRRSYPPDPTDTRGPWEVLRTGEAVVWDHVDAADIDRYAHDGRHAELMRAIATRSVVIVPLTSGDRVIGTLELATTDDSGRLLGHGHVHLATELADRAVVAVEHARIHEQRTHIATTLQRSLLPPELPEIPGLAIAARFRAAGEASEVGGDFYDVFGAGSAWFVVMGDVTGKGPEAAAVTALVRHSLRTLAMYEAEPCRLLEQLNARLLDESGRSALCTAVCARIDGNEITVACAGHPLPYLVRPGRDVRQAGAEGTLLGAFDEGHWASETVSLGRGDSLVLYTDGVLDARGDTGRYGEARLVELLCDHTEDDAEALAETIDGALRAFERGQQRDDVALLVVRAERGSSATRFVAERHFRPHDAGTSPTGA